MRQSQNGMMTCLNSKPLLLCMVIRRMPSIERAWMVFDAKFSFHSSTKSSSVAVFEVRKLVRQSKKAYT